MPIAFVSPADGNFAIAFCLEETDLKTPLRAGASDEELADLIRKTCGENGRVIKSICDVH